MSRVTLDDVNAMDRARFVETFGPVFEGSPWIAEHAHCRAPFADLAAMFAAMRDVVASANRAAQLALLRAHPELGLGTGLSGHSRREQYDAGLIGRDDTRLASMAEMNRAYRERFGFPFIVAVAGLTPEQVIARAGARLHNDPEREFAECLEQVFRIAELRLWRIMDHAG